MKCPACGIAIEWHTDHDCIIPLTNRVEQLERIARLAQERIFGEPSIDNHDELKKALKAAGYDASPR